jgi:hypothetical protein
MVRLQYIIKVRSGFEDHHPVGGVILWQGENPPEDWMFAEGQRLKVKEYPELYEAVNCIYGGKATWEDGMVYFDLPDFSEYSEPNEVYTDPHLGAVVPKRRKSVQLLFPFMNNLIIDEGEHYAVRSLD